MSTNNLSDEELDNLFRKSAETSETPYDPEDWKAMEKKLNKAQGGRPGWYKLIIPLLLIIGGVAFFAVKKLANEPEKVTITATEDKAPVAKQNNNSISGEKTEVPLKGEQEIPAKVFRNKKPHTGTGPANTVAKVSGNESKNISRSITGKSPRGTYLKIPDVEEKAQAAYSSATTGKQQEISPATGNSNPERKALEQIEDEEPALPSSPSALLEPDTAQALATENEELTQEPDSSILDGAAKRKSTFMRSIQFIVVAAPDVTTVKLNNPDAISANAGLLLGIPVTNRLSLVAGVVWTNKQYGATPEDYTPSTGYWSGRKLPNSIDAACQVLDIPLNIQYQLLERGKNRIALQAGLSSYMMLKEQYTYNYSTYSSSLEVSNQNRHWFGVQNVSVSYSRQLSPVFSIGMEPFIKIPMAGVGAGRVKLTSAGAFLTAGYTVSLRK